ncbi:UPF0046 protein C25E10.12 [Agrilus planipennis]|uniref:UPF0046 protein C25E10.12 n=1 Tax=Agrilus planipennis TaxID=224129 RepID=A0A7F5R8F6_AGRPL|nr:UPF0046 protein C25E10.12 [Agrilus planipennis]XP_025832264.1 UPF0046 protein C25E10.12 [Agrilus planipennis]
MPNVDVHPLANNPSAAWRELSQEQKVFKLNVKPPSKPVEPNKVRFVCMSDTHSLTHYIKFDIPDGDVFVHAGDFTKCGQEGEVQEFNQWLGSLPHKHKIVIAGNHELSFDPSFVHIFKKTYDHCSRHAGSIFEEEIPTLGMEKEELNKAVKAVNAKKCLTNCTYLEDSMVEIYGIKIYGTPWQPEFCKWAFNLPRGEKCLEKWNLIPENVDVLITHTPPVGHGDLTCSGVRAGCVELLNSVQKRIKPKYHVFGHIHEGYGVTTDGKIIFINATTCDINYIPNNLPIVFDIPLPPGVQKA